MKTTFNEIMRANRINFTLTKPSKKITAHSFLSLISYFTLFKSYLATLTLCFVFANSVFGQVTTNSGSGLAASYPSLDAAISALNAATITSPVVITMNSGATETAPAGGLVITQSGTATFPITIEGFSNLSRNVITASTAQVSGSVTDAVFKLVGADYLTIRYFEVKENDLNTTRDPITSNNKTEFGIALMANSATNGSQNNTITDNTINLGTTTYENSFGIYSQCVHQSTSLSPQTATNNTGINSNNSFNANTISNAVVGIGILITRPGQAVGLTNNSITNNTITLIPSPGTFANYIDWLPGQRSSGIETRSVLGITVTGNTISQTGNILNAVYGINITHIQFPLNTLNYTETVNNNNITLSQKSNNDLKGIDISNNNVVSGTLIANGNNINLSISNSGTSTSIVRGIDFGVIAGNISATTNVIEIANTHAATISLDISAIYGGGILSSSSTNTLMSNNTCKISLLQTAGEASGVVTGVSIGAVAGANTSINATTNTVEITGTSSGTGNITSTIYYIRTLSNAANLSLTDNVLKTTTGGEIKTTGSVYGIQHIQKFSSSVLVTGNTININRTGSLGDVYGLHGTTTTAASSSYACNLNLITLSGLSGSTSCYGIYNTDSGINKEVNSNTINISGINTGSTTGISSSCTSLNPSTSNNIISISTSSSATVGINTTARTNGLCDANNIQVTTNSSVAKPDLKGITCTSGSGPYAISNNLIHALSSTDAGTSSSEISGINAGISGITLSIHSNTISDFNTGATTGNPKIIGIIIKSAGTNSIYKNKIYNLSTSATGVATGVEGININTSNTGAINTIYNNIIGNLTSPASGNSECIRGIVLAGTSESTIHKVYFNTIYLSGTSTGTNFGGSGIYQTSHDVTMKYALDLRNNNIVNTIVPKGTGSTKTVALRRSGTVSLNYELTSNHNNLYGTSGAYYNGTIYNIADFKTLIGPRRDSASIAVLPNFYINSRFRCKLFTH
ncbi:MAG: hypothetical protein PHQ74_06145 [Crocinitomicaceae bacterium]|nr:hypothetical protein [Crocinitomicaceae bacterium]